MFWHLLLRTHQKISVKLGEVNGTWDKQPKKRLPTCGVYIYDPPPTHYSPVVKLRTWSLREATVTPWTWCSVMVCRGDVRQYTRLVKKTCSTGETAKIDRTVYCAQVSDGGGPSSRTRWTLLSWCPRFPILPSTFLKTAGLILQCVTLRAGWSPTSP